MTVFSDDGVSLDSDATVESLRFIRRLVELGLLPAEVVGFERDRSIRRLARGRTAMCFGGSYESSALAAASGTTIEELDKTFGFVAMPAGPRGDIASVAGGMAYAIFRQSRRPQMALNLLKEAVSANSLAELARSTSKIPPHGALRSISSRTKIRLLPRPHRSWNELICDRRPRCITMSRYSSRSCWSP